MFKTTPSSIKRLTSDVIPFNMVYSSNNNVVLQETNLNLPTIFYFLQETETINTIVKKDDRMYIVIPKQ